MLSQQLYRNVSRGVTIFIFWKQSFGFVLLTSFYSWCSRARDSLPRCRPPSCMGSQFRILSIFFRFCVWTSVRCGALRSLDEPEVTICGPRPINQVSVNSSGVVNALFKIFITETNNASTGIKQMINVLLREHQRFKKSYEIALSSVARAFADIRRKINQSYATLDLIL